MSKEQMDRVTALLRHSPLDPGGNPTEQREVYRKMLSAAPVPADVRTEKTEIGGVPAVRVRIADIEPKATIVHFHGGFYAIGSAETSVNLAASVARRTGSEVISVDYRLAPEHRFPAATDDALAAYRGLLNDGTAAASIILMGESAGAGLALATLLSVRAADLPMPAAAVVFSPWVDLTQSGVSMSTNADVDPSLAQAGMQIRADDYIAGTGASARDDLVSPLFADLHGLPPLLIQVGSHEVLLDDAVRLAAKAAADDVDVILDVIPGAPHVSQAFAAVLDESAQALDRAATFINSYVSTDAHVVPAA